MNIKYFICHCNCGQKTCSNYTKEKVYNKEFKTYYLKTDQITKEDWKNKKQNKENKNKKPINKMRLVRLYLSINQKWTYHFI